MNSMNNSIIQFLPCSFVHYRIQKWYVHLWMDIQKIPMCKSPLRENANPCYLDGSLQFPVSATSASPPHMYERIRTSIVSQYYGQK